MHIVTLLRYPRAGAAVYGDGTCGHAGNFCFSSFCRRQHSQDWRRPCRAYLEYVF